MASNFALVEMQLFCEAVLLLATLVTKVLHLFAHVLSIDCASALLFKCVLLIAQATCCTIDRLLRDPSVVARSIGWCANDRSIVRAEQSMDSANRSTARNNDKRMM